MPINQPATQQILEIEKIKDDAVYLKNGSLRAVVMVSSVNFDLKSEEEQNIILYSYQAFLNSLDFSLQIIIHSRKLNIDNYLEMLRERETHEQNSLLKTQISEYVEFVKSFVEMNAIIAKTFYVVIPYDLIAMGGNTKRGGVGNLLGFNKKAKKQAEEETKKQNDSTDLAQLEQRVEQVTLGIRRIGLRIARLNSEELIELFYNLYNPEEKERSLPIAKEMI